MAREYEEEKRVGRNGGKLENGKNWEQVQKRFMSCIEEDEWDRR